MSAQPGTSSQGQRSGSRTEEGDLQRIRGHFPPAQGGGSEGLSQAQSCREGTGTPRAQQVFRLCVSRCVSMGLRDISFQHFPGEKTKSQENRHRVCPGKWGGWGPGLGPPQPVPTTSSSPHTGMGCAGKSGSATSLPRPTDASS